MRAARRVARHVDPAQVEVAEDAPDGRQRQRRGAGGSAEPAPRHRGGVPGEAVEWYPATVLEPPTKADSKTELAPHLPRPDAECERRRGQRVRRDHRLRISLHRPEGALHVPYRRIDLADGGNVEATKREGVRSRASSSSVRRPPAWPKSSPPVMVSLSVAMNRPVLSPACWCSARAARRSPGISPPGPPAPAGLRSAAGPPGRNRSNLRWGVISRTVEPASVSQPRRPSRAPARSGRRSPDVRRRRDRAGRPGRRSPTRPQANLGRVRLPAEPVHRSAQPGPDEQPQIAADLEPGDRPRPASPFPRRIAVRVAPTHSS